MDYCLLANWEIRVILKGLLVIDHAQREEILLSLDVRDRNGPDLIGWACVPLVPGWSLINPRFRESEEVLTRNNSVLILESPYNGSSVANLASWLVGLVQYRALIG